jgi:ABC-type transport system involved in multi-copper enzyme maturation permease subunit
MTATTAPHPAPQSVQTPESGLWRATAAAEWIKFRTVRGWLVGLLVAAGLMVIFTFVVANGHQQGICTPTGGCQTGHPYVPIGPDGQAVADSYQYYAQTLTGDGTLTARVNALSGLISTGPADQAPTLANSQPALAGWAKAGLLITPTTTQGSAYATVMTTGGHGDRFQTNYTHDQAGLPGTVTAEAPRWLQLRRSGDTITGYDSTNGTNWHRIGSARLSNLPSTVNVGLFVTSPMTAQQIPTQATARFDDLALTGSTDGTWQAHSIGMDPQQAYPLLGTGSAQASATTVTVTGSGDLALAVPTQAGGDSAAQTLLFGLVVALIVLIVIASSFVTGEYRRGLIRVTLTATPQRGTVLVAKALVIGAVAFGVGAVAAAAALPIGVHVMTGGGNFLFPMNTATVVRVVAGTGLLLALAAIGAFALAAIVRRAAAAISIGIVVFVLPLLLGPGVLGPSLSGGAASWLYRASPAAGLSVFDTLPRTTLINYPFTLANGYYPLSAWTGLAVLATWSAAALTLAGYRWRRRDA